MCRAMMFSRSDWRAASDSAIDRLPLCRCAPPQVFRRHLWPASTRFDVHRICAAQGFAQVIVHARARACLTSRHGMGGQRDDRLLCQPPETRSFAPARAPDPWVASMPAHDSICTSIRMRFKK